MTWLFACWVMLKCFFGIFRFFFKKLNLKKKSFRNNISVKEFGSRSGLTFLSGLIWVQTVCKGYQQTTKVATSGERVKLWWKGLKTPDHHQLVLTFKTQITRAAEEILILRLGRGFIWNTKSYILWKIIAKFRMTTASDLLSTLRFKDWKRVLRILLHVYSICRIVAGLHSMSDYRSRGP